MAESEGEELCGGGGVMWRGRGRGYVEGEGLCGGGGVMWRVCSSVAIDID